MNRSVLFFTDSAEFGGAEQVLVNLMAGLDRRRWQAALFYHESPGISPLVLAAKDLSLRVRAIPPMPLGVRGAWRVITLAREIRSQRPAVFHANLTWPLSSKYGLFAAMLARVPVVIAVLHAFVDFPYTAATRLQLRLLASRIDGYLTVSHDLANRMRRTFNLPKGKVQVIHNGIPADKYIRTDNPNLRAKFSGPSGCPVILTAARLVEQKGLSNLLQAVARVPEAVFLLAGDGPLRSALEEQARSLGVDDRVIFLGYRKDIRELLSACDIFVLPSVYEGLPLSILEAMAAGKAVVASHTGGIGEAVIHGETGLLVTPADPYQLAGSIRSLLADPQLAHRFGEAGRERLRREFTVDRMVEQYASTYDTLLARKGVVNGT